MSVSWYSKIFVGALLGDVVTTKETIETATKYNEDTGVPYSVATKTSETCIGGAKVENPKKFLIENGLDNLFADHNQREKTKIVGVEVVSTGSDPAIIEIDMTLLQNAISDVKAKFERLGITAQPKVFLSNSVSY